MSATHCPLPRRPTAEEEEWIESWKEQFFEFPEAVEYLHVSYISEAEASLYEILVHTEAALEQMRDSGSVIILGTELTQLLNCAKMYPPAWVLALEAASTGTQKRKTSKAFSSAI